MADRDAQEATQTAATSLEANAAVWLEPMRAWLKDASLLDEAAQSKDLPSKKIPLQKIFGSNLTLHAREARGMPAHHWFSVAAPPENQAKTHLVSSLVRRGGLEPPRLSAHAPQACLYTNFNTCADICQESRLLTHPS